MRNDNANDKWFPYYTSHGDPYVVSDPARPMFTIVCKVDTGSDDYGRTRCELLAQAPVLMKDRDRLTAIVVDTLRELPVGNLRLHTAETIPGRVAELVKRYAETDALEAEKANLQCERLSDKAMIKVLRSEITALQVERTRQGWQSADIIAERDRLVLVVLLARKINTGVYEDTRMTWALQRLDAPAEGGGLQVVSIPIIPVDEDASAVVDKALADHWAKQPKRVLLPSGEAPAAPTVDRLVAALHSAEQRAILAESCEKMTRALAEKEQAKMEATLRDVKTDIARGLADPTAKVQAIIDSLRRINAVIWRKLKK